MSMRNFFKSRSWTALILIVGFCLSGCSRPNTAELQTYTIYKHKVALTPPKDWKVRHEKDGDQVAAVVFEPPAGGGHIAITVTDNITQTQEFMNRLGNGIRARQGKIVKEWYEHKLNDPDKQNAYHMEFEVQDPGVGKPPQKGMQVQIFTQAKVLYSLVFTADPPVYDQNRATFLAVVKSFEKAP